MADCSALEKHQRVKAFGGSNPSPTAKNARMVELAVTSDLGSDAEMRGGSSPSSGTQCGSSSMVESLPSKQYVDGSIPFFRSI